MDKPNKGNTITIKLNGENPPQLDVPPKEVEASIDPIPKVIKINSNLSESDNFMETAAAQESVDESFDWIIPESSENDIEEFKKVPSQSGRKSALPKITTFSSSSSNTKKKNGRPLGTILISAVFAILIGTTIGVVMLKLVITTPTNKTVVTEPTVVTEKPANTESKTTEGKTSSAAISQVTAYVIQGGVFSSEAGAKETSSSLDSKGIPSQSVEMDGKYYLFLGVADSIEAAKALGGQYKENGIEEVFAKPLLLDEKKFTDVTTKEKTFLKAVPTIYQTLSLTSSSALLTKSLSEDSSKALLEIEEQLKSSVKNKKLKDLKAELVSANEKLKAFQESKSEKNLSDAQQHLLNFMSLYFSK